MPDRGILRRRMPVPAIAIAVTIALTATAFAQAGSTGGTIGLRDKSASGKVEAPSTPRRPKAAAPAGLVVASATYGGNCGAPAGNMTRRLAAACNGRSACDYVIDYRVIGDPVFLCAKDYVARWRCGGTTREARVSPEAGYARTISLSCRP